MYMRRTPQDRFIESHRAVLRQRNALRRARRPKHRFSGVCLWSLQTSRNGSSAREGTRGHASAREAKGARGLPHGRLSSDDLMLRDGRLERPQLQSRRNGCAALRWRGAAFGLSGCNRLWRLSAAIRAFYCNQAMPWCALYSAHQPALARPDQHDRIVVNRHALRSTPRPYCAVLTAILRSTPRPYCAVLYGHTAQYSTAILRSTLRPYCAVLHGHTAQYSTAFCGLALQSRVHIRSAHAPVHRRARRGCSAGA
jgi:hypothetical protein